MQILLSSMGAESDEHEKDMEIKFPSSVKKRISKIFPLEISFSMQNYQAKTKPTQQKEEDIFLVGRE